MSVEQPRDQVFRVSYIDAVSKQRVAFYYWNRDAAERDATSLAPFNAKVDGPVDRPEGARVS